MTGFVHFDEALQAAREGVVAARRGAPRARILIITDIFGRLRLVVWSDTSSLKNDLGPALASACGVWWSGEIIELAQAEEHPIWEPAWKEAEETSHSDVRFLPRHRSRTSWFSDADPAWSWRAEQGPPVVSFYSFKGGLGRSTSLAAFAIQRAQQGERVVVLDFDLDAPGIGNLLSADAAGLISRWGIVDYLLERPLTADLPLTDYHHRCARVAGDGDIRVFPAGTVDEAYLSKLAKIDLEESNSTPEAWGITRLLRHVRDDLKPDWILLDARTGVSEPAGRLLSGIADLHVLFGTTSEQSWRGLSRVLDRLGRGRIARGVPQADLLLVQAMVPEGHDALRDAALAKFGDRALEEFGALYYTERTEDDRFWDVGDTDTSDAPHIPVALSYRPTLAHFDDISRVAEELCEREHYNLAQRIMDRFRREPAELDT